MTKITELGRIAGLNTKSRDLFVVVSLDQGEDGTKNITRKEVIQALQLEVFDNITITGGTISNVDLNNVDINIEQEYTPDLDDENYFYVKDVVSDSTVAISFGDLTKEIAKKFKKLKKVYVSEDGSDPNGNGSYLSPYRTLERAFIEIQTSPVPVSISVLPGNYYTNGNLSLPDECTMVSTNGQYATKIIMNPGYENSNCILVGSGCYVQGFAFDNLEVDNFDEPTGGFAIAFRPGATIKRSPYIRDCSQISNYRRESIAAPLNPRNSFGGQEDLGYNLTLSGITGTFLLNEEVTINGTITATVARVADLVGSSKINVRNVSGGTISTSTTIISNSGGSATISAVSAKEDFPNQLVGRGGGMLLADRSILNQNSIFPYMLAFGATPRSPNGVGYVAKDGAGINGISSMSIFQRCSFYALRGGQITLNNSGTQFGDISMRANGSATFVVPAEIPAEEAGTTLLVSESFADILGNESNVANIINNMWTSLVAAGYTVNETFTRRDAANWLKSVENDFRVGKQISTRVFAAGLFDYKGDYVFDPTANAGAGTLLQAFLASFDYMRNYIVATYSPSANVINMLDGLVTDVTKGTLLAPEKRTFGSLIESISHQFNLAGAGVNKNALPLNFRRLGRAVSASGSVVQQNGGRVRWSGADEINNQFFAKGLRINGRNGKIEGRPFTSSVRRLARRAANSRT